MKFLVKVLIVSIVTVLLALFALDDTGYVLISRTPWVVELSLTMFVILLALTFLVLYFVIRFTVRSWTLSSRVHDWRLQRSHIRARKSLNKGLLELAQRNWKKAEKILLKNVNESESPLLNYLGAASAAQEQSADARRDQYLADAHTSMPEADVAVGLTQADLQLRHGQLEQALATLKHLQSIAPKHHYVLKLLARLYGELQDWQSLRQLLPDIKRSKALSDDALAKLETHVYSECMLLAKNHDDVSQCWNSIPKPCRKQTELLKNYINSLLQHGADTDAVTLLHEALEKNWQPELLKLYGNAKGDNPTKQLKWAELWLSQHENDPALLAVLGQLAVRNELWGKARAWYEASINIRPIPSTYRSLGELLEKLEEPDKAAVCYRRGLLLID